MDYTLWEATQEVIRTSPVTLTAESQLRDIATVLAQWDEGLVLAIDAVEIMALILSGDALKDICR